VTRLLAVVTDTVEGRDEIDALTGHGTDVDVRIVLPAVEENQLHHALGDVDGPVRDASERLQVSLEELHRNGVAASGTVGDPDPVLAAQDALREAPADEVVIFERTGAQERWFEHGLFERAQEEIPSPLRMILVSAGDGGSHVVGVERADPVRAEGGAAHEVEISGNLPRLPSGDLTGMVIGVVGTIAAIVLAAAGPGPESAAGAASILIAMGITLVNMAHVVGLTLFESVHYRGGWEAFFRTLSLVGTPMAVAANLLILLLG
jgi:hypothetical protein